MAQLTYKEFKDFHKNYYSPQNCLVFLYGNIPTEKQLDFLQENVLDYFEKSGTKFDSLEQKKFLERTLKAETQKPFKRMAYLREIAPLSPGEKEPSSLVSWLWGNSDNAADYTECLFLGNLLCAQDGSPLSAALLKSGLGKDLSSACGVDVSERQITFSVGLRGVKKQNEAKVKDFILREIQEIYKKGISQDDIESTFNKIDFMHREVRRSNGPFSLVLMRRALRSWNYGGEPGNGVLSRDAFERLKEKVCADPNYIKALVKKYLIDNMSCAWTVIVPDKKYLAGREAKEKKITAALAAQTTKAQIKEETAALRLWQQTPDSEKNKALIPHIRPRDLKAIDDKLKITRAQIKGGRGFVPLFKSLENTNGIAYVTAAFPFDIFEPELYPCLPFFAYILNELGWGDLRWDKSSLLIAKTCGGFGTTPFVHSCPNSPGARAMAKENRAFAGRQWLFCKVRAVDNKIAASVDMMRDCLQGARFDDKKRVQTLAEEFLSDLESSALPNGHSFAVGRAERLADRSCAIDEIWDGFCQIFTMRKLLADLDGTIQKMKFIASKIFDAGAVLHVTADKASMPAALKAVKKFALDMNLRSPVKRKAVSDQAFFDLTNLSGSNKSDELVAVHGMVGFAALSFKSAKYASREAVAEKVLAHLLSSGALWEKIRTVGGAYGAGAQIDAVSRRWNLYTYRDPNPQASLAAFDECLRQAAATPFDRDTVEKAIAGTYSDSILPRAPKDRGASAFLRELFLIDAKEVLANTKTLLSITPKDLQMAARRLLRERQKAANSVLIVPQGSSPVDIEI